MRTAILCALSAVAHSGVGLQSALNTGRPSAMFTARRLPGGPRATLRFTRARPAAAMSTAARRPSAPAEQRPGDGEPSQRGRRIVLISGFESFNVDLYRRCAREVADRLGDVHVDVFSDRDLSSRRTEVDAALADADCFIGSLLFDYDDVEFLLPRVQAIRGPRLVFECATELMAANRVGSFQMAGANGEAPSAGPPPAIKAILSKFGSGKEEDKLAGYLKLLKVGPELLQLVPGEKASDLRSWLEAYRYWNSGGDQNVVSMLTLVAERYLRSEGAARGPLPALVETPALGLLHPLAPGRYFRTPAEYVAWRSSPECAAAAASRGFALAPEGAPRVAVLLYRKHVITAQRYIPQLLALLEAQGLCPLPIFINGVEAHTVVRDLLTSEKEDRAVAAGRAARAPSYDADAAACVDAIVSTVGFPLVGGPAGSMEAGRNVPVATALLAAKDVPYVVAAPLLLQDLRSWARSGVQGLQSVVLYSLPELDGAIDTVVLGGLAADRIGLVPERVRKLAARLHGWIALRRTPPAERRLAVLVYGFPPNVGAVGTAALLNVPASLDALLRRLHAEGYDVGSYATDPSSNGQALVAALAILSRDDVISRGPAAMQAAIEAFAARARAGDPTVSDALGAPGAGLGGARVRAVGVTGAELQRALGERMAAKMESCWGELRGGARSGAPGVAGSGELVVAGLQLGNIFVGVQPLLGIEGDPMRLLFDRDLTPHPQYAAFYAWLQTPPVIEAGARAEPPRAVEGGAREIGGGPSGGLGAHALVHVGMHGTVEWLPGQPLGNDRSSWPDELLGSAPNLYIYAANNPSESILAKRRGYGTLVSYQVPPYGRAGLYLELAALRELLDEYRAARAQAEARAAAAGEDGASGAGASFPAMPPSPVGGDGGVGGEAQIEEEAAAALRAPIAASALRAGLLVDVPWGAGDAGGPAANHGEELDVDALQSLVLAAPAAAFDGWARRLAGCLDELQNRLFSAGLHALGAPPTPAELASYLEAYFGERLSPGAVGAIAHAPRGMPLSRVDGLPPPETAAVSRVLEARSGNAVPWLRARLFKWLPHAQAESAALAQLGAQLAAVEAGGDGSVARAGAAASEEGRAAVPLDFGAELALAERAVNTLEEAVQIKNLLERCSEELDALIGGLDGGYVLPAPGGDLLRDGAGVLPTGRNIHSLDPYRMPSAGAWARGQLAAARILEQHRAANGGAYPETVAVALWGLDAIKTRGESVAIALALVGARPVKEGTGRVVRYELIDAAELGRPRIDVLATLSGIFRDSFANVVELLDDCFERAAAADEPHSANFVKKHADELRAQGVERPAARLFSNPPSDYGSMVNERVGSGDWEEPDELGDTWVSRNTFSYGRASNGESGGVARREVLEKLLSTTDRIVQEIDSVEYGLTDITEYFANTGAIKKAAEKRNARSNGTVSVSIVEAFGADAKPRDLEATLRLEYRSKLLNPKWAAAMVTQGAGGAFEVSQRMTAMVGWAATAKVDKFVFDGAAERYALDPQMAATLRKNNPEAFKNVLRRLLEAAGRGMWDADDDTISQLKQLYSDADDTVEGVS